MLERQRLRKRVADTPTTDDDDSHDETCGDSWPRVGSSPVVLGRVGVFLQCWTHVRYTRRPWMLPSYRSGPC